jgi:hypothetical protein
MQSSANRSLLDFPVLQGINREISRFRPNSSVIIAIGAA